MTTVGTESRGQDPFSLFIEHQEKQIVLLATGGTLTSLAQADTGSLAGGAQMDVWKQIVARDVTVISAAINRALVRPFLETAFPGKPVAAEFKIEAVEKPGKKETAELAATLRNASYTIDQGELEEAVGFKLEKDAAPQSAPGGMLLNKEPTATAKQTVKDLADTLQDALEAAMVEAVKVSRRTVRRKRPRRPRQSEPQTTPAGRPHGPKQFPTSTMLPTQCRETPSVELISSMDSRGLRKKATTTGTAFHMSS